MFAGLRRFQKIIWAMAAVVIIPTFVVFFSPSSMRAVRDGSGVQLGSIDGEPISRAQFLEARNEALLRMFITSGRWPENEGDRVTDYAYSWMVVISQLQEQGIAVPSGTVIRGRFSIRVAISNHRSTDADFDALVEAVVRIGSSLITAA